MNQATTTLYEPLGRRAVEFFCARTGGSEEYTGKDMVATHQGMNIYELESMPAIGDAMVSGAKAMRKSFGVVMTPRAALVTAFSLICAVFCGGVSAQTPQEAQTSPASIATAASAPAITRTAKDADLKWNPCPPFLPKGCGIAVLNGEPAKNNLDVFFKLPGKSVLPRHWHTSAERMILVAGELHVEYDGQKTAILKPGTYAYGPARKSHSGKCVSKEPCILFIAFELPLDAVPTEETAK